jgi:hypothetical protein
MVRQWATTITGTSADPTGGAMEYVLNGRSCDFYISFTTNGTSNAVTKTITLPVAASSTGVQTIGGVRNIDNAQSPVFGMIRTRVGSNIADLFLLGSTGNSWTASGGFRVEVCGTYITI